MLSFQFANELISNPFFSVALIAITSVLMVSRVPTPSLKYIRLGRSTKIALAVAAFALAALAVYAFWATVALTILIYLVTIPLVIHRSHVGRDALRKTTPSPFSRKTGVIDAFVAPF